LLKFKLTYVIATRNRLSFLKITLEKLFNELQPDEEIVIVDGDSTDGSKEYLEQLLKEGKIHQFISEPDRNQAHGWNKAMLMAKGVIIKKIIDDDVFCYQAIRECKNHMLLNPDVDVMISNDLSSSLLDYKSIHKHSRLPQFEKWSNGGARSFTFGDVHMLIRKSALAYIGLYNTVYVMMDWEYALRISYLKANIAFYTGYNALSVSHPQTVSALKNHALITDQGNRANIFYEYPGDHSEISLWSKIKISIGKVIYPAKKVVGEANNVPVEDMQTIYTYYYNYIAELNKSSDFSVINTVATKLKG
jgi:glycosyltransferase involved in cell wall biosynthesis